MQKDVTMQKNNLKKKTEKEYAAFNVQLVRSDAYVVWDSRPYFNLYYHFFQL